MSKFLNKKMLVDGIVFDSKKEACYYLTLKRMLESGDITDLQIQVPFQAVVNRKKICKYIADFTYVDKIGDQHVIDVKSPITEKDKYFRLKKKLIEAIHNINIEIWK